MILPAEKYFMLSVILKLQQLTWANPLLLKKIIKHNLATVAITKQQKKQLT